MIFFFKKRIRSREERNKKLTIVVAALFFCHNYCQDYNLMDLTTRGEKCSGKMMRQAA
jgi:hypothetical protein